MLVYTYIGSMYSLFGDVYCKLRLGKTVSSTDSLLESLDLVFKDLDKIYLLLSYMGTPSWFFPPFSKWEQLQWLSICFPERRGGFSLKGKEFAFCSYL